MVLVAHHTKHATYTCPDSGPQCAYIIAVGCLNFTRLEAPLVGDSGRPLLAVLKLKLPKKYFNFENLLPATTNRSDEDLCEFLDKLIVPVTEMKGNLGNIRMVVQLSYEL